MMLPRASLGRTAARVWRNGSYQQTTVRGMASHAGLEFEASESAGVKVASREVQGPTTTLTVVAKAGSRYEPLPGYSEALEKFAFKSTLKRSALRITRENELLGGQLSCYRSRENLVLSARFLNNDLPYYAELLGEVVSQTKYCPHELNELVFNLIKASQNSIAASPSAQALDAAHTIAFHQGLGSPLTIPAATPLKKYVSAEGIASFAEGVYTKPSIAVVSSGSNSAELSKWIGQFFNELPTSTASGPFAPASSQQTKYFGGEQRIASQAGNAIVIAFPGSNAYGASGYKPELAVLATLLGGESSIKWTTGSSILAKATEAIPGVKVSTSQSTYSDAGLFHITVSGQAADRVSQATKSVVDALNNVAAGNVAAEDIKKAIALARFRVLDVGSSLTAGSEATGSALIHGGKPFSIAANAQDIEKVTEAQVKAAAKSLLSNKASVATVGELFSLPYASDLGLTV
ncbi:cytochrome b-c1 complex subunit 2 [Nannizzia gypsea CBS 118893]|uniref:Cytochrome b-c1 complex subunit 2, mitochondrial n=1 Tax=Arthroderma gypseum (strain ATCC MYA-4604 / CBS 118893) TaxID=535722 RepID=E4UTW6_ARTGP|nr:cytochrome b-c1 complex subunit 2 [Nannizzia gypsea CBS 118893]EFR00772.1 cytochrome b-c1 complex subunit 2 [Nannizzia gypsea CBS 118893]